VKRGEPSNGYLREVKQVREVRNLDRKLVCRVDELNGIVEIALKDCKTLLCLAPDGKIEVINTRST